MYLDVDKAAKSGVIGKVKVYLNNKLIPKCLAAKHGKNGFVEFYTGKLNKKRDDFLTLKKRGNVKITFNLA